MAVSYVKSAESAARARLSYCPTGFTNPEKIALINAWRILKANLKKHSTEIFLRFFIKSPYYLKWFKITKNEYDNESLHGHMGMLLKAVEGVIEEGLMDIVKLNIILSNLTKAHHSIGIYPEDMAVQANIFTVYVKEILARYMTPTLESGLNKLNSKLAEGYTFDEF